MHPVLHPLSGLLPAGSTGEHDWDLALFSFESGAGYQGVRSIGVASVLRAM